MATPVIGGDGTVDVAGTSNGLEHGTPTVGALRPIGWVKWLKILPDGVPATSPAIAVGGRLHVNVRQRTSNASSHLYAFGAD
jgi:hypothetical protein